MTTTPSRYGHPGPHAGRPRADLVDDVDEVVVDRIVSGVPVATSTPAERRAAIAQLAAHGLNELQIARRTGFTSRTVHRHLSGRR
jgi:DNA-binding NarL/FixJ family response regulator